MIFYGGDGDDVVRVIGPGNGHLIYGSGGNDYVEVGEGLNGRIEGDDGDDVIRAPAAGANSVLQGGAGNDTVIGSGVSPFAITGGDGDDLLVSTGIRTTPGASAIIHGGNGDDIINVANVTPGVSFGVEQVACGAGNDRVDFDSGVDIAQGDCEISNARPEAWAGEVNVSAPAVVGAAGAAFPFSAEQPGVEVFECRVDDGAWQTCGSPFAPGPLPEGARRLDVRVTAWQGDQAVGRHVFTVASSTPPAGGAAAPASDSGPQACEEPLQLRRLAPSGRARGRIVALVSATARGRRLELRDAESGRVLAALVPDRAGNIDTSFSLDRMASRGRIVVTADGRRVTPALLVNRRLSRVSVAPNGSVVRVRGVLPVKRQVRARIQARACNGKWSTRRSVAVRGGKLDVSVPVRGADEQLRVAVSIGRGAWMSIPFGIVSR